MIRRAMLAGVLLLIPFAAAVALEAVVLDTAGTVEYRLNSGSWQQVQEGMTLPTGAQIVTGFRSSLELGIDRSTVEVGPLSRTTIAALAESSGEIESSFDLPYGRLSADVRRRSGQSLDFRVRSPISTAAVRGTEFSFDGFELAVSHGDVSFENAIGQTHSVREGQVSRTYRFEPIISVEETFADRID